MLVSAFLAVCILTLVANLADAKAECRSRLYEARGAAATGTNGFALDIEDAARNASAPAGYVPGHRYRVSVRGWRSAHIVQTFRGFGITALFSNDKPAGKFEFDAVRRAAATRCAGDARVFTVESSPRVSCGAQLPSRRRLAHKSAAANRRHDLVASARNGNRMRRVCGQRYSVEKRLVCGGRRAAEAPLHRR